MYRHSVKELSSDDIMVIAGGKIIDGGFDFSQPIFHTMDNDALVQPLIYFPSTKISSCELEQTNNLTLVLGDVVK
jgi:hypothetical protein